MPYDWENGICQNWNLSESVFRHFLNKLEFVRIGICQNWNLSESEFVIIGICQNWNRKQVNFEKSFIILKKSGKSGFFLV